MTPNFASWERDARAKLNAERVKRAAEAKPIAEWAKRIAAEMPPLTPEQLAELRLLWRPVVNWNPPPDKTPTPPRRGGRSVDPAPGTLYGAHLKASAGACDRCRRTGSREVDHCHEHGAVRGLICRKCNSLAEKSMGDDYRKNCLWCAWDIWLERELAGYAASHREA